MKVFEAVTIDPPGSRDLDDAISVRRVDGGWLLDVAFPDLTGFEIEAAARSRVFTRYRANGVDSMLPDEIVDQATLTPGQDRRVVLATLRLDESMRGMDLAVERATFRSAGRLTYAEATAAAGDASNARHAELSVAARFAMRMADARTRSGALTLYDLEHGLMTDEDGAIVKMTPGGHVAEMIVREAMIVINAALAQRAAEMGLPLLYRNHRAKPVADRESLRDDLALVASGHAQASVVEARAAMVLDRADVGTRVKGHWALALPVYAWFTSPLRRYADVVNQKILLAALAGAPAPYAESELEAIAAEVNAAYERQRQDVASALKAGSERAAVRRIEQGEMDGVDGLGFKAILKVSKERGVTDKVADEALRRLQAGQLSSKDIARALIADIGLARKMAPILETMPNVATSVVNYGEQALGWTGYAKSAKGYGPNEALRFAGRASIAAGGKTYEGRGDASSMKDAQHLATLDLILQMAGVRQASAAPAAPAAPAALHETRTAAGTPDLGNSRGRLQELCQGRGWAMPRFESRAEGPPHAPTFTAVASVDHDGGLSVSGPCRGGSKKEAERLAAADLLQRLEDELAPAAPGMR